MRPNQSTDTTSTFERAAPAAVRVAASVAHSAHRDRYTAAEHAAAMDRLLGDLVRFAEAEAPAETVREPKPYRGLRLVGTTRYLEPKPACTTR